MSTQTMTITAKPIEMNRDHCLAGVGRVEKILERYKGWNDPLSKRLVRWGNGVAEAAKTLKSEPEEHLPAIVRGWQERLDQLMVNPITQNPLQDPVIERNWTWERNIHTLYRSQFPLSPLDGQVMNSEPLPHLFAAELIQIRRLKTDSRALVAIDTGLSSGSLASAQPQLRQLARNAVLREQCLQLQEDMNDDLVHMTQSAAAEAAQTEQVVRRAEQSAEEHAAALKEEINSLKAGYEEAMRTMNADITFIEEAYRSSTDILQQENALERENNAVLREQLEREIAAKRQEMEELAQTVRQRTAQLTEQLVSIQTTSTETLAATSDTHRREIVMIQGQRDDAQAAASQLSTQLRQADARIAEMRTELREIRAVVASQQGQIQQLRNAANDDDGCIIS